MRLDPLLIVVPDLSALPELQLVSIEFAWGIADESFYAWQGRPFAKRGVGGRVPQLLHVPPGLAERLADGAMLVVETLDDDAEFIVAVTREILRRYREWIVWCEQDRDQRPRLARAMTLSEVAMRLADNLRDGGAKPFVAWNSSP